MPKRFRVALSFSGDKREFVGQVAEYLAAHLGGKGSVLYDMFHRAHFARPELDVELGQLYHRESELIVVIFSSDYEKKSWCGIEWAAIRGARKENPEQEVMLMRFDGVEVKSLYRIGGFIDLDNLSPKEAGDLILERYSGLTAHGAQSAEMVAAVPVARKRELEWLNFLLSNDLSDREKRYVGLSADMQRERKAERALKGLMPTTLVLEAFGMSPVVEERSKDALFEDALVALRSLPERPAAVRRLALLGEPGAGKTCSLERIAVETALEAIRNPAAPVPLLVRLNKWTKDEPLKVFIRQQVAPLTSEDIERLREDGRAFLLLDAVNEIPAGQRQRAAKVAEIVELANDSRLAGLVISCRERDFSVEFRLPFDRLTLQPLTPLQIYTFLQRAYAVYFADNPSLGTQSAEECFWQIAGKDLLNAWTEWRSRGETLDRFLSLSATPFGVHEWESRRLLGDRRSLLKLAGNPFLLTMMLQIFMDTGVIPANRARLIAGFLTLLHRREADAREKRGDGVSVPSRSQWREALVKLAEAMQRLDGADGKDGARTSILLNEKPKEIDDGLLNFSIDAIVLQSSGGVLSFTHQLLQESLAGDTLLSASALGTRQAHEFWPSSWWWRTSGWEVVAEIAAEACVGDEPRLWKFLMWLAQAQPEVACNAWWRAGAPPLPENARRAIANLWLPRMVDEQIEPSPLARAAIGRALGRFGLDTRPGVGLRRDGMPDIAWATIPAGKFTYQEGQSLFLPQFEIARFPVTNQQYQVFIERGGYVDDRWWFELPERFKAPEQSRWDEPNSPRVHVTWSEAVAFCRWLSSVLNEHIALPTEEQWERAARGRHGRKFPWGNEYKSRHANCHAFDRSDCDLGRTSAVGIYPRGSSPEGVLDLVGNVWEWCRNEFERPVNVQDNGREDRVRRGCSWSSSPAHAFATDRRPSGRIPRNPKYGFRVVRFIDNAEIRVQSLH